MHSAAFLLLSQLWRQKQLLCLREQRQCKITCNLVVNGNVIKSLYAEIVAVLRTHEGAAVVGRNEKFKSAAADLTLASSQFHAKFKGYSAAKPVDHSRG